MQLSSHIIQKATLQVIKIERVISKVGMLTSWEVKWLS